MNIFSLKLKSLLNIIRSCFFQIIPLFLIIFSILAHGAVEIWSLTILHTLSVIISALWIFSTVHSGKLQFYKTPADFPVLIFLLITFSSLFFSVYHYAGRIQLYKILNYILIFYLIVNTVKDRRQLNMLLFSEVFIQL